MSVSAKQIINNMANMTTGYIVRKLLTFAYFTIIARYMSVEITGNYYFLVSFSVIIILLMDAGLSQTLVREGAKNEKYLEKYLGNVLSVKIFLTVIAVISGVILLNILNYPSITIELVYLLILMMVFESFAITFYASLRARHEMKYEARGYIIGHFLTLVVGGIAIMHEFPVHFLIIALIVNQIFNFFYSYHCLTKILKIKIVLLINYEIIKPFTMISVSFLISALFTRLMAADTFLLSTFKDKVAVGLFSVPSTIIEVLRFIPFTLSVVLLPALSAFHMTSMEKFQRTFEIAFKGMLIFVVLITVIIFVFGSQIIDSAFGAKYLNSITILRMLVFTLIPLYLCYPVADVLNACNKQFVNMLLIGISSIIHIGLSILLIPHYGAIGIAYAAITGNSFMLISGMYFVNSIIPGGVKSCFQEIHIVLISSGITVILMLLLEKYIFWFIDGIICSILYLVMVVLFKGMTLKGFNKKRAYGTWLFLMRKVIDEKSSGNTYFTN